MNHLKLILVSTLGIAPLSAVAQDAFNSCQLPDIGTCPSLYAEKCQDVEYRESSMAIGLACIDVLANNTADDASCAAFDPTSCQASLECDPDNINFYEGYNCQRGVPTCPISAQQLDNSFGASLSALETALGPYSDVIDFNPDDQGDVANLCSDFTIEKFDALLASSTADDTVVQGFEQNLSFLGQCADVAQDLVDGPPPSDVYTTALWASAKVRIEDILIGVGEQRSALEVEIESLRGSAAKVRPMYGMYLGFCQE